MRTKIGEAKFVELFVHAVTALAGQERGMATELNKILYFSDFAHVRRTGYPITGVQVSETATRSCATRLGAGSRSTDLRRNYLDAFGHR